MDGSTLTLNPSILTVIAALLGGAAAFIWWVVRKKRKRVWLPTLRLIKGESNPLPKMKLVPPPIFLFLCFLLSALTIIGLTSRPSERQYRDISADVSKIHLYADLSPSVGRGSFFQNQSEKRDFFARIYVHFAKQGSISASSSLSKEITHFTNYEDFKQWVDGLSIHTAGTKLGQGINDTLEALGPLDRLVVISDRDKFSWSDFNWRYLETKLEVLLAPYPIGNDSRNIFIDAVELISHEGQSQSVWKVTLARNYSRGAVQGHIEARIGDLGLQKGSFVIPDGEKSVDVEVQWPWSKWGGYVGSEEPMVWTLTSSAPNVLAADDSFRTRVQGVKKDLLIVSDPKGEMFLEDAIHHLKISLDVLGFRAKRQDVYRSEDSQWKLPLWIVAAGKGPMASYCPLDYESRRLEQLNNQSQGATAEKLPIIWLMPQDRSVSYQNLCWCYSRLIEGRQAQSVMPTYCEDLESRDQYISVLRSTGALQVGGSIDDATGALAWHRKQRDSGAEVFAFTLPLKPSKSVGLSYDMLPTLTKTFLELSHVMDDKGQRKSMGWPRLAHKIPPPSDSNVPREESLLLELELKDLPRIWRQSDQATLSSSPGVREEDDPRLWIELAFWVLAGLSLLEGAWVIVKYIRGGLVNGLMIFVVVITGLLSETSPASVKLVLGGFSGSSYRGEILARDVSGRTSIVLDEGVDQFSSIGDEQLFQPWLWLRDEGLIRSLKGDKKSNFERWLKRGGFLVVENQRSPESLKAIVNLSGGEWKPIPPDHEIMRSFHLLDSLPKCASQVWQGYHYDNRIAVVAIPFGFIESLLMSEQLDSCARKVGRERATRIFINILMVALATDYKKDQIHLPEILKRLR